MVWTFKRTTQRLTHRIFSIVIAVAFFSSSVLPQGAQAQVIPTPAPMPAIGSMVPVSPGYTPAIIRGLTLFPENPLQFSFYIDLGDSGLTAEEPALKETSQRLINYFMAGLTIPKEEFWVNLSPYEQNRIIPDSLGQTAMGRDMLAQDYLLKQLTSSLMYPEDELGSKFWTRVKERAMELYGTDDIPTNVLNKVWIAPESAEIYIHNQEVFLTNSRLKVMLEKDLFAQRQAVGADVTHMETSGTLVSSDEVADVVREVILPEIEYEVNHGQNFAVLRQIFNSVILASWYKDNLKETLLGKVYADQNKVTGIDDNDQATNQAIYKQYVEAFKAGAYDYIKEEYNPATQAMTAKKYFSGGVGNLEDLAILINGEVHTPNTDTETFYRRVSGFSPQVVRVGGENVEATKETIEDLQAYLDEQSTKIKSVENKTAAMDAHDDDAAVVMDVLADKDAASLTIQQLIDVLPRKVFKKKFRDSLLQKIPSQEEVDTMSKEDLQAIEKDIINAIEQRLREYLWVSTKSIQDDMGMSNQKRESFWYGRDDYISVKNEEIQGLFLQVSSNLSRFVRGKELELRSPFDKYGDRHHSFKRLDYEVMNNAAQAIVEWVTEQKSNVARFLEKQEEEVRQQETALRARLGGQHSQKGKTIQDLINTLPRKVLNKSFRDGLLQRIPSAGKVDTMSAKDLLEIEKGIIDDIGQKLNGYLWSSADSMQNDMGRSNQKPESFWYGRSARDISVKYKDGEYIYLRLYEYFQKGKFQFHDGHYTYYSFSGLSYEVMNNAAQAIVEWVVRQNDNIARSLEKQEEVAGQQEAALRVRLGTESDTAAIEEVKELQNKEEAKDSAVLEDKDMAALLSNEKSPDNDSAAFGNPLIPMIPEIEDVGRLPAYIFSRKQIELMTEHLLSTMDANSEATVKIKKTIARIIVAEAQKYSERPFSGYYASWYAFRMEKDNGITPAVYFAKEVMENLIAKGFEHDDLINFHTSYLQKNIFKTHRKKIIEIQKIENFEEKNILLEQEYRRFQNILIDIFLKNFSRRVQVHYVDSPEFSKKFKINLFPKKNEIRILYPYKHTDQKEYLISTNPPVIHFHAHLDSYRVSSEIDRLRANIYFALLPALMALEKSQDKSRAKYTKEYYHTSFFEKTVLEDIPESAGLKTNDKEILTSKIEQIEDLLDDFFPLPDRLKEILRIIKLEGNLQSMKSKMEKLNLKVIDALVEQLNQKGLMDTLDIHLPNNPSYYLRISPLKKGDKNVITLKGYAPDFGEFAVNQITVQQMLEIIPIIKKELTSYKDFNDKQQKLFKYFTSWNVFQTLLDNAALEKDTEAKNDSAVGGIDLNPDLLDLQIKRDDNGIPLPLNQQPLEHMNIDGFVPVIINIVPVPNLPLFLGLMDSNDNPIQDTEPYQSAEVFGREEFSYLREH